MKKFLFVSLFTVGVLLTHSYVSAETVTSSDTDNVSMLTRALDRLELILRDLSAASTGAENVAQVAGYTYVYGNLTVSGSGTYDPSRGKYPKYRVYFYPQAPRLLNSNVKFAGPGATGCTATVTLVGAGGSSYSSNAFYEITVTGCTGTGNAYMYIPQYTTTSLFSYTTQLVVRFTGPSTSFMVVNSTPTVDIVKEENLTYTTADNFTITYDAYRPTDWMNRRGMPALLWFHGGGWTGGDKSNEEAVARSVAALGTTVIVPNYSFGNTSVNDAAIISKTLFELALPIHVDPLKISIGGGSAGAHLALMGASSLPTTYVPKCIIDIAGPSDLPYVFNQGEDYPVSTKIIGNVFGTDTTIHTQNSPIAKVYSYNTSTKFFVAQQLLDNLTPQTQATRLVNVLRRRGIAVVDNYHNDPNPYPSTKATEAQITHVFDDKGDLPPLVKSYFYTNCLY